MSVFTVIKYRLLCYCFDITNRIGTPFFSGWARLNVEHLRRPMLRSCGATDMELAANKSKTVSKSGTIQAFIKNIFV